MLSAKRYLDTRSISNYSASTVKQMLKENSSIILLDVRTAQERKKGSIKPSIHIPLHEISFEANQLKKYESREIICYCQSGIRSVSAVIKLKKMGFNASNMSGGFSGW